MTCLDACVFTIPLPGLPPLLQSPTLSTGSTHLPCDVKRRKQMVSLFHSSECSLEAVLLFLFLNLSREGFAFSSLRML